MNAQCCTEDELRSALLRARMREGSIAGAVACVERQSGRPLEVTDAFLLDVESEAIAIDEMADVMLAVARPHG